MAVWNGQSTAHGSNDNTPAAAVVKVWQGHNGGSATIVGQGDDLIAAIVSAAHVFDYEGPAMIKFGDGKKYEAYVHVIDRRSDVAILSAQLDKKVRTIKVADHDPQPGEHIWKIGYPSIAKGAIDIRDGEAIQLHGRFEFHSLVLSHPGDSGGALVNEQGDLVSEIYGYELSRADTTCGSGSGPIRRILERVGWPSCIRRPRQPRDPQSPQAPGGGATPKKPLPVIVDNPTPDPKAPVVEPIKTPPTPVEPKPIPGPPGKDGKDGKDGQSVDVAALMVQINSALDKRLAPLEKKIDAVSSQIRTIVIPLPK